MVRPLFVQPIGLQIDPHCDGRHEHPHGFGRDVVPGLVILKVAKRDAKPTGCLFLGEAVAGTP